VLTGCSEVETHREGVLAFRKLVRLD